MRPRPMIAALAAVASLAAMVGCGSSSTTTSVPSAVTLTRTGSGTSTRTSTGASVSANFNSCTVATPAEAGAALGQTVSSGVLGTATVEGGLASVFYGPSASNPHTPDVARPDSVRVVVVKEVNATTWYTAYKSSPTVHAEPVSGYGDAAFYDGNASLSVRKGDTYMRIAVVPAGAAPSLPAEQQLAAAILSRL